MEFLENILSQDLVRRLGWTLVHFVWQAGMVALLLAIVLKLLRKSSANLRYIAACLALMIVVLLPAITINLIPVTMSYSATEFEPEPAAITSTPVTIERLSNIEAPVIETQHPVENVTVSPRIPFRQKITEALEPFLPYVVLVWLVGVFGLSVRHLGGWTQMQRLRRRMVKPVDESLRSKLKELAGILGIHRVVQLMESALVQAPTVVGWLKPVILLPASVLTGFSADQLEAILAHELAHIKRYDYLVNMLQTVVEILGFYHPAVWWVSKRIRVERENCCDDIAVSVSGDSIGYAKTLASFEEIQAGQPELAVAASGGTLFRRICRLLGKDSADSSRASWIPSVVTILLIAIIAIPTTLALTGQTSDKSDKDIETTLIEGFRENRAKFKCGMLAWTRTTRDDGFIEGPRTETKGSFQLWWDGKKIATKFAQERTDLDADVVIDRRTGGNAYDGGLLSRKPRFELYENWFDQVIRWTGPLLLDKDIATMKKLRHVSLDWSIIEVEGEKQIKLIIKNLKDGASGIRYFDLSRGCNQVRREIYNAQGRLYSQQMRKLQQVNGDGWFPVEVDMKSINRDGKVTLHQRFVLDLDRCSFNDPAAIPEGIFEFSTAKEQGQLNKIVEKYSGGKTADENNENVKSVCESVENYIAAALASEDEKAAAYAYPESAVAQQTDDTREVLQGQQVQILAVCSGDWNALAISSVILGDRGRIATILYHLKKVILEQEVHWLIDDIDLETLDSIETEIKRFLERNPKAKTVIFKPQRPVINPDRPTSDQTAVQVEGEESWGEAVEGVRVRLQTDKTIWKAGEVPKLKVDARNNGARELLIYRTQPVCELSVDGQSYLCKGNRTKVLLLGPGKQYDGLEITLDDRWYSQGAYKALRLSPGKHPIQVTSKLDDARKGEIEPVPTPVIVKSNPVEIEILPNEEKNEVIAKNENLEILRIDFEPIHQGKNEVNVKIKNKTDKEQIFGTEILSSSSDEYGKHGAGWVSLGSFEVIQPQNTETVRFVYKIARPVNDYTWVWFISYNPLTQENLTREYFFVKRFYSGDLERSSTEILDTVPASQTQTNTIHEAFRKIQDHIRNQEYEKVWELYTEDYKIAEFHGANDGGFGIFKEAMEQTESGFTWDKNEFLNLQPEKVSYHDGIFYLSANYKERQWLIHFKMENSQYKIDWIDGFTPRYLKAEIERQRVSCKQS